MKKSKKRLSNLHENFDDPLNGDLSSLMLNAQWRLANFEMTKPKTKTITLRVSNELLKEIKTHAKRQDLEYTKFIRIIVETYLRHQKQG